MLPTCWLLPLAIALAGPPPVTTLSGHFDHAPATADSVRLIVGFRHVAAALRPGGNFQVQLPALPEPLPTQLSCGDQQTQLYLSPGDQLVMRLDYQDFDKTLTYSGRGSVVNNYLAQALYKFSYGPPAPGMLRSSDFPEGTPAEARQQATALRQARRAFLAKYAQAHPLPAAFVHEQQVAIDAEYATQQLAYAYKQAATPMPANYFDFMADAPAQELSRLCRRSLIENSLLANMIYGYGARLLPPSLALAGVADVQLRHVSSGQLSTDPAEGPRLYALATRELGTGRAREWAMEALIYSNLRDNPAGTQVFYRTFRQHNTDSTLARSLRRSFVQQQRIQAGLPAPDFTLTDPTGRPVSLRDFHGKVVYLDFWGTWCSPCMREMTEFSHALKEKFVGRDVVFLYVSMGDPEAKWQQALTDQHLTSANSVHLREAPDSPRQVATDYQVNSFPTYWLIGRDGRILDFNAPRPSDGDKTVTAIEQALKS